MNKKGQTQLITAVLLTGIMITLVVMAYIWGIPLIEKQKDNVKINNMEDFFLELNNKIQSVAKNGGKEKIKNFKLSGTMKFIKNGFNDNISAEFETTAKILATGINIYLVGSKTQNPPVGKEPGVVKTYVEKSGNKYNVNMDLYYRNLTTADDIYKIDLVSSGKRTIGSGEHSIIVEEAGSDTIEDGKTLHLTKVKVRFV